MTRHLLVTNDFPPKVGGIQNYLWELWRRLPPDDMMVHTTPHPDSGAFDAAQAFAVVRSREPWLLPGPHLARRIDRLAERHNAELVVIDPALPAGLVGRSLDRPYAIVVHGAEAAIPARLPGARTLLRGVLAAAAGVIAAGAYPAAACRRVLERELPTFVIPPGVDAQRFRPLGDAQRHRTLERFGLKPDVPLVASVSRLVPRKGMDTLVRAAGLLAARGHSLQAVIAGDGRDRRRLSRLAARLGAPVSLLGRIAGDDLAALYGCADVFAMLCRNRLWGLEQEGFGIVFLEAAAAGVPQIAGSSGGAHEAVAHDRTGIVLQQPEASSAARAIAELLDDEPRRRRMGAAARQRALRDFSYDILAERLRCALETMSGRNHR